MKISKFLLFLTVFTFSSLIVAQEVEVPDNLSLNDAIDFVKGGGATTIVLTTDGGIYKTRKFEATVPMTIKAAPGLSVKPMIVTESTGADAFIKLWEDLTLDGVKINGYDESTGIYDSVKYVIQVRSLAGDANEKPNLVIKNCEITNIYRDGNPEFSVDGNILDFATGARAGTVLIENNIFSNTGDEALRSINTHKNPVPVEGAYCSSFEVRNCTFSNIRGTGIKIEGDGDSTNVDPQVVMENLTFDGCQRRVIWHRDMFGTVIRNILITNSIIGNDDFGGSQALITFQSLGTTVAQIDTFNIEGVKANGDTVTLEYGAFVAEAGTNTKAERTGTVDLSTVYNYDPGYADAANGDYTISSTSPILSLGHDGLTIGDRRWAKTMFTGTEVEVPDNLSLNDAIDFVKGGGATTIVLTTDGGIYKTRKFEATVPMTIKAAPGLSVKPMIVTESTGADAFIKLWEDLTLDGVKINGLDASTGIYDSVKYVIQVRSLAGDANEKPNLVIKNCEITNIYRDGNPEFSVDGNILDFATGARAGTVLIENNIFSNTGDEALRSINTHKNPVPVEGAYCSSFEVRNCTFSNIRGTGIKIEGDGDSTNVDPQVVMENLTFDGCQRRVIWHRDMFGTVIRNILITNSIIGNDDFGGSQALITFQSLGTTVAQIDTFNIESVKANGDTVTLEYGVFVPETGTNTKAERTGTVDLSTVYNYDPGYADAANGDYTMSSTSPILSLGHDGLTIGDRRWAGQGGVTDVNEIEALPSEYTLSQNYPNPFNPTTNIQFTVPASGRFTLKIYNILGQEVATLLNNELSAGTHRINFDASRLASGVYVYSLQGNNIMLTKKMLLLK